MFRSGDSRGFSRLLQLVELASIPWLMALFHLESQEWPAEFFLLGIILILALLSLFCMFHELFWLYWAHVDNNDFPYWGQLISNFYFICNLYFPFPCNLTYSLILRLGHRHLWGAIFCMSQLQLLYSFTCFPFHWNIKALIGYKWQFRMLKKNL